MSSEILSSELCGHFVLLILKHFQKSVCQSQALQNTLTRAVLQAHQTSGCLITTCQLPVNDDSVLFVVARSVPSGSHVQTAVVPVVTVEL